MSVQRPIVVPPALERGDRVKVIAPSGPFDAALVRAGIAVLGERYRVEAEDRIFERVGFLAGDDDARARELQAALLSTDVRAIFAARGGYGADRIVDRADWSQLRAAPKWIVGFSDITALHLEAARVGVASMHACNVTALGQDDPRARDGLFQLLEAPTRRRQWEGLGCVRAGDAEGPLFGGNLAILFGAAAAGRLEVPEGALLVIEDVGERPYRVDRMLTALTRGGHLARASGIVCGEFSECSAGPDGVTVEEVLAERLERLGLPVVTGAPIGHGRNNEPLALGLGGRLCARSNAAALELGDAAHR
jgi:muramoyltetrapeptide carboxypeptidase